MGFCDQCLKYQAEDDRKGPRVAIFGAGIAGLTAAHELVDRGFVVDVFESTDVIGGLAATQYFEPTAEKIVGREAAKAARNPPKAKKGAAPAAAAMHPDDNVDVKALVTELLKVARDLQGDSDDGRESAFRKVSQVGERIARGALHAERALKLPGEHGFRAFHSFYRHVTDTMQRIPLSERRVDEDEDRIEVARRPGPIARSVADNLIPTYKVAVALEDNVFREIEYDRRQPRSAAAAMYVLGMWMIAMGFAPSDLGRVMSRLLKFLTSCRERRYLELTEIALMEYLGNDQELSIEFRSRFTAITRFLIAIRPNQGDAMTQAMVMCRLLMDPAVSGEAEKNVDRVLNGPTSERWFIPWQFYLSQQKVRFIFKQNLERFWLEDGKTITHALLSCTSDGCDNGAGYWLSAGTAPKYSYFVSAVPGDVLWGVIGDDETLLAVERKETEDLSKDQEGELQKTDEYILRPQKRPSEQRSRWIARARARSMKVTGDPPLEAMLDILSKNTRGRISYGPWMSGIQFYLSDSLTVLPGHIHFPDSKWSLTAVCQSQFWGGDFHWRYGNKKVRSIISVDICEFDQVGEFIKKKAFDCTKEEIAKEVWFQLRKGLQAWDIPLPAPYEKQASPPIPPPYLDHHLDERIHFGSKKIHKGKSDVAFWIPLKGSWKSRPGPLPPIEAWDQGYRVRLGTLVVVGHFAQTFTSLNIMEAANESARHGVNAILADYEERHPGTRADSVRKERCTIWPLEADEPAELDFLKTIDRNLFWDDDTNAPKPREDAKDDPEPRDEKKYPDHLFDLLQVDRWIAAMFPSLPKTEDGKVVQEKDGKFWHKTDLWDSDGWKRFESNFGNIWDKLLTLGRFSTPY